MRNRLDGAKELKKLVYFSNIVVSPLLEDLQVRCSLLATPPGALRTTCGRPCVLRTPHAVCVEFQQLVGSVTGGEGVACQSIATLQTKESGRRQQRLHMCFCQLCEC